MMWALAIAGVVYMMRAKLSSLFGGFGLDAQKTVFYGHFATLVGGVIYVLPIEFLGLGQIKSLARMVCLWGTICTAWVTIKANYGLPSLPPGISMTNWRAAMAAVQPWLQKAIGGVDFHMMFFALIFLTAMTPALAVLILARRSLWSCCSYASKNMANSRLWLMVAPHWAKMKQQENVVIAYSALAEILLAIQLTIGLALPSRQIFPCLLYWNYLRTRFQAPRSHPQHAQAWAQLGEKAAPLLRAVPVLNKPIDMAKNWFRPQYS
eukprot:TRINITY_DN21263_c0_g1_i1.p1 TRINITY_DN21263_c0_g1~~TRINITY_DN21263_c0_g1_i1.p1  ORF type:complete len:265 (+),score=41.98 TRINITY_DN21263_c0_g1_i1:91-885(+)